MATMSEYELWISEVSGDDVESVCFDLEFWGWHHEATTGRRMKFIAGGEDVYMDLVSMELPNEYTVAMSAIETFESGDKVIRIESQRLGQHTCEVWPYNSRSVHESDVDWKSQGF